MLDCKRGLCVAKHFQCVLLEVLTRTKEIVETNVKEANQQCHLRFSVTLSYLLEGHPYLLPFVLQYFRLVGPFFYGNARSDEESTKVIETAYRLLKFSPAVFCSLWNWSQLFDPVYSSNAETRWCWLQILAIILKLDDEEKSMLLKNVFGEENLKPLSNDFKVLESNADGVTCDGSEDGTTEVIFSENDLCGKYAITAHILLPKISYVSGILSDLVAVPSMSKNLEALSIALVSQKAILLEGAVGCGKTSLVEHLACLTGRAKAPFLLKVQLGDQTDSKVRIVR